MTAINATTASATTSYQIGAQRSLAYQSYDGPDEGSANSVVAGDQMFLSPTLGALELLRQAVALCLELIAELLGQDRDAPPGATNAGPDATDEYSIEIRIGRRVDFYA